MAWGYMRTQVDQGTALLQLFILSVDTLELISGPLTVEKIALYASTFQLKSQRHDVNKEPASSLRQSFPLPNSSGLFGCLRSQIFME